MSAPAVAYIHLVEDRLTIRTDSIVAVRELGESDIDIRTGNLRLGVPEGATAEVMTTQQKFYVKTEHDDIFVLLKRAWEGVQ